MKVRFGGETCHRYRDPVGGGWVIQLTCGSSNNINIYGEQPYCSPNGRRVAIERFIDPSFTPDAMLIVADLDKFTLALVADDVSSYSRPCNNAFGEFVYYWTNKNELKRVSLLTYEVTSILVDNEPIIARGGGSVSPDHKYLVFGSYLPGPASTPRPVVLRYDLRSGRREVLYEHPEMINPHPIWEPVTGKYIALMRNNGAKFAKDGSFESLLGPSGPSVFLIDVETGEEIPMPIGRPYTCGLGHQAFIPGTNKICFTTMWNFDTWELDPLHTDTTVMIATPGESKPIPFPCPEHRGNHIAVSKCGTYFVMDSYEGGIYDKNNVIKPMAMVVGNLKTGKYRVLVENTRATGGGNQVSHVHPYITTDNRHVIFNSDGYGAPHVFAAEITPEFLTSLG